MPFKTNIFVNCPFDDDYLPLLRPLLFSVLRLGFEPRIALESLDSSEARIEKIFRLVTESKFAIHDISRLKAKTVGEYYRMNMPFEIGLDVGCKRFKGGKWSNKKCLILESEKYRYKAALSDLSNSDIEAHENSPTIIVTKIRDWLNNEVGIRAPGSTLIWGQFNDFIADNYDRLIERGFSAEDIEKLQVSELITCMKDWLKENP